MIADERFRLSAINVGILRVERRLTCSPWKGDCHHHVIGDERSFRSSDERWTDQVRSRVWRWHCVYPMNGMSFIFDYWTFPGSAGRSFIPDHRTFANIVHPRILDIPGFGRQIVHPRSLDIPGFDRQIVHPRSLDIPGFGRRIVHRPRSQLHVRWVANKGPMNERWVANVGPMDISDGRLMLGQSGITDGCRRRGYSPD
jgi:hypothetical protein